MSYEPGDDLILELSAQSDEEVRNLDDAQKMIDAINRLIGDYGFKVRQWGEKGAMQKSIVEERAYIEECINRIGFRES